MQNKFKYLHSFFSDVTPPHSTEPLQFWALKFDYDLNNSPNILGVVITYLEESVFEKVDIEIMKSQTNFEIEKKIPITGEELYPLIKHSVELSNFYLQEACNKLQIPAVEGRCPLWDDMKLELEDLASDLNHY